MWHPLYMWHPMWHPGKNKVPQNTNKASVCKALDKMEIREMSFPRNEGVTGSSPV